MEKTELNYKPVPTFTFRVVGDKLECDAILPEDVNVRLIATFLLRLSRGEFAPTIVDAIYKCTRKDIAASIIETWNNVYKTDKPAIRPTEVFKRE